MEQILSTINIEAMTQNLQNFYMQMTGSFLFLIGACVILTVLAFYSYRILRLELAVSGAIGGGILGYTVIAPLVFSQIPNLPDIGIDYAALTGIVCTILGWVLAWALYKVAIFLLGAGAGFYGGMYIALYLMLKFPEQALFQNEIFFWAVCGLIALAAGLIFLFLFKFLYILTTSVGGMLGVAYLLGVSVFGASFFNNPTYLYPTLAAGAVFGIVAMVVQYKKAND